MKGFLADVEFIWGFQSRVVGMSKSSPSFLLPPPTTVLGAIAEAYARRKGLSEGRASATMTELAKDLLLLTYKPLNAVPLSYQDLNRILAVRTSAGVSYPSTKDPYGSYDAPARGKTILSTVDERPPTLRIFAVFKDSADVEASDLWRVRRIGSKESMVSVVEVVEGEPEVIRGGGVETDYLLPLTPELERALSGRTGLLELEFVPVYSLRQGEPPAKLYLEGRTVKHVVSVPPFRRGVRVRLPPGYVGYKMGEEVAVGHEG
ncbi:type I-A CRISPR-associated protein Cas5a [Thermofilum sp.]|uniref:type I-A CRISPR-associated protein Cas5a n=1 Tax=Thermofilum sp. TaxID=1961369 RepID=UPI00316A065F